MFHWLSKNLSTFLLSLVLAIGVWVGAVNASDPDQELVYPEPVPFEIVGQDTSLLIINDFSKEVELTIRAPRSIWQQLKTEEDYVHAILDLSGLDAGIYTVEPQIQIGIQPAKLIVASPASVEVVLEKFVTREFPISLNINVEPAVGYQAGSPVLSAANVEVSGAKSFVEKVALVQAAYTADDVNEDVDAILALEAVDEDGQLITNVSLSSEEVNLSLPMSQQGGYRDVAVKVTVTGQVENLYRLTDISVFPPVVTLYSSDSTLMDQLSGTIETEALDIEGVSENISVRLKLNLPENVLPVGDQSVLVEASVEPILGSRTVSEQEIDIINLDPSLFAALFPPTVDVIISGPLTILDQISAEELRVVVDADELALGEHQLTPLVEILTPAIKVESILPESNKIIIQDAPILTPTAQP